MQAIARFLFTLAVAGLLVFELGLAALGVVLVGEFVRAMWLRSAWQGILASLLFVLVAVGLVRAWRHERLAASDNGVHPGPSMSRIPISGSIGAVYMLQFVIWVLVVPAVGLFYAVLIGGGLLLLPVAFYFNHAGGREASRAAVGGVVGLLCGLLVVSVAAARVLPTAGLFGIAVVGGIIGAAIMIRRGRRDSHPSLGSLRE